MTIGTSVVDPTFPDKINGRFGFLSDLVFPGCLHAAVVRSPFPHARVGGIETGALRRRSGVRAVFTFADVPATRYNPATVPMSGHMAASADKRLLTDVPQHIGDGIALVVADTGEQARLAATHARVEWRPQPAILTIDDALRARRVLCRVRLGTDDVGADLVHAPVVLDQRLELDPAQHVCLETHACVAVPDGEAITVWTNSQSPGEVRRLVAAILGLSGGQVRVRKVTEGGGFGAKQEMYEEALVAWAARMLGRPVRLAYSRREEFTAGRVRNGARLRLRAGFDRIGRLLATDLTAVLDAGAYASHSPYVLGCVSGHLTMVYPHARHRFTGCAVSTNTVPAGAYRGYGVAEAASLVEQVLDMAAHRVGRSPVALRLSNLGRGMTGARLGRCLEHVAPPHDASGMPPRQDRLLRGTGLAVAMKSSVTEPGSDRSRAELRVSADARVVLVTGTCDGGTGSSVALAQIVADILGMTGPAAVRVLEGDSATTPVELGSTAQRSVFVGGQAAARAADMVRHRLLTTAARLTGRAVDQITLHWPEVLDIAGGQVVAAVPELVVRTPDRVVTGTAEVVPAGSGVSVCAVRIGVAVDPGTGVVAVENVTVAVDCGTVVNPCAAQGQVTGAVSQGVGLALIDRLPPAGEPSILDHGVPRAPDLPRVETVFLGAGSGRPPSGVGELAIVAVPAAVANAVADATGARYGRFPLRPEVVAAALDPVSIATVDGANG